MELIERIWNDLGGRVGGPMMISFGFTIYKFFQFEIGKREAQASGRLLSPSGFALIMIGTGLIALAMSTIQHRQSMQTAPRRDRRRRRANLDCDGCCGALSVLGVLAFLAVLFRE